MDEHLLDVLLSECIAVYEEVYQDGMQNPEKAYYGAPPQSVLIACGTSDRGDDWHPLSKKDACFRYTAEGLTAVPDDTEPDRTESGMYYRDAYAEWVYHEGSAILMLVFGKRFARCFRYTVRTDGETVTLTEKKLLWIS